MGMTRAEGPPRSAENEKTAAAKRFYETGTLLFERGEFLVEVLEAQWCAEGRAFELRILDGDLRAGSFARRILRRS